MESCYVHPTAIIEPPVSLGRNVKIWHFVQVRSNAELGDDVSVGKGCFVDSHVKVGDGSRIQNSVNLYNGLIVGKSCFIGPSVVFTNDMFPRVGNRNWIKAKTILEDGCSLGAGSVIRCGIKIGAFAMVAAGAVVTRDIPPFHLAMGVPARCTNKICACGRTVLSMETPLESLIRNCCHEIMSPLTLDLAMDRLSMGRHSLVTESP